MIPKRVKQFYVNVTDKMTEKDYDYANEILNKKELELFMKLSKSEQKHSIRIAKDIEFIIDNNETDDEEILKNRNLLMKSALLHDIGKITKRLNVIDKSIHFLGRIERPAQFHGLYGNRGLPCVCVGEICHIFIGQIYSERELVTRFQSDKRRFARFVKLLLVHFDNAEISGISVHSQKFPFVGAERVDSDLYAVQQILEESVSEQLPVEGLHCFAVVNPGRRVNRYGDIARDTAVG